MEPKSVCIVGVLDRKGSTNVIQALSFARAGYNILPINYRTIISRYGMDYYNNLLISAVKSTKPYLVVFSKVSNTNPDLIKMCSEFTKTWYWFMDPIPTAEAMSAHEYADKASFVSATSESVVKWFEERGVKKCHHILEGLDYDVLRPVAPVDELKADISFIGTQTKERDEFKKLLEDAGYNVKFYGPGYSGKEVVDDEFAKVCSSSKFMLSLNTYNNIPRYFSDRIIRYAGCGTCILHWDATNTLNEWYENGKHIIYFKDKEDLLDKLKNTSTEEAFKIATTAREHTLNNYTWNHTIQKILEIADAG
jgi:spore maturation protein CgeB